MLNFSKIKITIIYLILLFLTFLTFLNFQKNPVLDKKVNLGLDLQGGSYLLLEIDTSLLLRERLQEKVIPIKKFLKENNISYTNFIVNDEKLIFSINKSDEEKFDLLFNLRNEKNKINIFIPQYNSFELSSKIKDNIEIEFSKFGKLSINNSAIQQSIEIVRKRIDDLGTKEPTILQRGDKRILVELPGIKDPGRIKNLLGKTAKLTFRLVGDDKDDFGFEKMLSETGEELKISKRIILSGDNLTDSQPRLDSQSNQPVVSFNLDRVGTQKFAKATSQNVGKRISIILDEKIISSPVVREAITGGAGNISGNFSFQDATDLALLLRSGSLPTEIKIVEERTVGPDLGKDSIESGTISLIVGFILVIIFMIFKYRIFGVIANISLVTNLIMLIGVLTLLEATLTLPGIAGIILTVGMAVDANVLIFERIKEELKTEKSSLLAFDLGYRRAQLTVLDANITTLIAAFILFMFGSGPVKGFAVTLGVGILSTLFSAYFIARHLTSILVLSNKEKNIKI